jgi:hypothetical protein
LLQIIPFLPTPEVSMSYPYGPYVPQSIAYPLAHAYATQSVTETKPKEVVVRFFNSVLESLNVLLTRFVRSRLLRTTRN